MAGRVSAGDELASVTVKARKCASDSRWGTSPWIRDDLHTELAGTECQEDDGVFAGCILTSGGQSQLLVLTDFVGLDGTPLADLIPEGSEITGFRPRIRAWRTGSLAVITRADDLVRGGNPVSNLAFLNASDWPTSEQEISFVEGETFRGMNMFGQALSWTREQAVDSETGFCLMISNGSGREPAVARNRLVESAQMDIFFTPPSAGEERRVTSCAATGFGL